LKRYWIRKQKNKIEAGKSKSISFVGLYIQPFCLIGKLDSREKGNQGVETTWFPFFLCEFFVIL
jgi:hypothetical protein